jgi:polyferredoxin
MGHGALGWISIAVITVFAVGAFLQRMFFCRYFCPLAAVLDPFSKLGLVRVTRDSETCTDCTACNKRCYWGLEPMAMRKVTHRDCVNCFECVEACPVEDCLQVKVL